jgi:hypothetical protein
MKIRLVGAELLHADGQTDVAKLTVAFRNFANAPQNYSLVKNDTPSCTLYKFRQTLLNKRIYIYIYIYISSFLYFCFTPQQTTYILLDLLLSSEEYYATQRIGSVSSPLCA